MARERPKRRITKRACQASRSAMRVNQPSFGKCNLDSIRSLAKWINWSNRQSFPPQETFTPRSYAPCSLLARKFPKWCLFKKIKSKPQHFLRAIECSFSRLPYCVLIGVRNADLYGHVRGGLHFRIVHMNKNGRP